MNPLWQRLAEQVKDKEKAKRILVNRGHMTEDGTLTQEGLIRSNMTPEERAIDRQRKRSKEGDTESYVYDNVTNRAVKVDFKYKR